jgi:hypothetical protein
VRSDRGSVVRQDRSLDKGGRYNKRKKRPSLIVAVGLTGNIMPQLGLQEAPYSGPDEVNDAEELRIAPQFQDVLALHDFMGSSLMREVKQKKKA